MVVLLQDGAASPSTASPPALQHDRKWLTLTKWAASLGFDGQATKANWHVTKRSANVATEEVPYWLQGEAALHMDEAIEARSKLRRHRLVVDELQRWWWTALRSRQHNGGHHSSSTLSQAEYMRISLLLSKAMVPTFDVRAATQAAEEDWLEDVCPGGTLERTRFMDCIFELADIVCSPPYTYSHRLAPYCCPAPKLLPLRVADRCGT